MLLPRRNMLRLTKRYKISIKAKSFLIYRLEDQKIIAANNEKLALPLASLSKIVSLGAFLDFKTKKSSSIIISKQMSIWRLKMSKKHRKLTLKV